MRIKTRGDAGPNCASDAMDPFETSILPYGRLWRHHGVLCFSQTTGLVCINEDGRGFFLARQRWTDF